MSSIETSSSNSTQALTEPEYPLCFPRYSNLPTNAEYSYSVLESDTKKIKEALVLLQKVESAYKTFASALKSKQPKDGQQLETKENCNKKEIQVSGHFIYLNDKLSWVEEKYWKVDELRLHNMLIKCTEMSQAIWSLRKKENERLQHVKSGSKNHNVIEDDFLENSDEYNRESPCDNEDYVWQEGHFYYPPGETRLLWESGQREDSDMYWEMRFHQKGIINEARNKKLFGARESRRIRKTKGERLRRDARAYCLPVSDVKAEIALSDALFFGQSVCRPCTVPNNACVRSVITMKAASIRNKRSQEKYRNSNEMHKSKCFVCSHEIVEGWKFDRCAICGNDIGELRLKEELRYEEIALNQDKEASTKQPHSKTLIEGAVRVDWLLAFTFDHDCWSWPTYQVVNKIIRPATRHNNRCRYVELPEVKPFTGTARVFMSHCWTNNWGDLVLAACTGARHDRHVWIDIFVVRQWPGNVADLDFSSVVAVSKAMFVVVPYLRDEDYKELRRFGKGGLNIYSEDQTEREGKKSLLALCFTFLRAFN